MAEMTTTEALDHARGLVTKFAKPLLRLEEILTAASAAENTVKAGARAAETLQAQITEHQATIVALQGKAADAKQTAVDEIKRADQAVAAAKSRQQAAEREATSAIAAATTAGREREAELERQRSTRVAAMNGEIAALTKTKTDLEAAVRSLKERFA